MIHSNKITSVSPNIVIGSNCCYKGFFTIENMGLSHFSSQIFSKSLYQLACTQSHDTPQICNQLFVFELVGCTIRRKQYHFFMKILPFSKTISRFSDYLQTNKINLIVLFFQSKKNQALVQY